MNPAGYLAAYDRITMGYFYLLNSVYFLLLFISLAAILRHLRRMRLFDAKMITRSRLAPPISILIPAHNEQAAICDTVRSALGLRYPEYEVIVVNDGSTDDTLGVLRRTFGLRATERIYHEVIRTKPVTAIYAGDSYPNLVVVNKENGGKADALNAGLNLSRYPLFCSLDADSILEEDALLRAANPFMHAWEMLTAVGGIVRVANGCRVDHGRVREVHLGRHPLPNLQIVEYLRAFLCGRMGWSRMRALLIISGAFGLFKKQPVLEVGGYDTRTVGEDMMLVTALHEKLRRSRRPYRLDFIPDPVCWTEVPQRWRILSRQRRRWHRGLCQSLYRHLRMLFNPRYGAIGMFAMPYFLLLEGLGPAVEILGYAAVILSFCLGIVDRSFFTLFLTLAVAMGVLLSVSSILLEELTLRRYPRVGQALRLCLYAVAENFGYRQATAWWRFRGLLEFMRRQTLWGEMEHRGLAAHARVRPAAAE